MAERLKVYPVVPGTFVFCHPDMENKLLKFLTVHRMYVQEWDDVVKELRKPFVDVAFGLRTREEYEQGRVHPCAIWDWEERKMVMCVMLGPFEIEDVNALDRLVRGGQVRWYKGNQVKGKTVLDCDYVLPLDGHDGVSVIALK